METKCQYMRGTDHRNHHPHINNNNDERQKSTPWCSPKHRFYSKYGNAQIQVYFSFSIRWSKCEIARCCLKTKKELYPQMTGRQSIPSLHLHAHRFVITAYSRSCSRWHSIDSLHHTAVPSSHSACCCSLRLHRIVVLSHSSCSDPDSLHILHRHIHHFLSRCCCCYLLQSRTASSISSTPHLGSSMFVRELQARCVRRSVAGFHSSI